VKKLFWNVIRTVAAPGKNLWMCAAKQQQSLSLEERKKEEQKQTDRQQLLSSMDEFNKKMNDMISALEAQRDAD
jgi:hypothetical protein